MTTAKTAISLDLKLLEKTDEVAKETNNSRSGVIAIALSQYFERLQQQEILSQLNDVYRNETETDLEFLDAGKKYFAQEILENEQW